MRTFQKAFRILTLCCLLSSCIPNITSIKARKDVPDRFETNDPKAEPEDVTKIDWRTYFNDKDLENLIDTALENNQELNIFLQEIEIAKNEIGARQGAYLPMIDLGADSSVDKPGKYTRNGAVEEQLNIEEGKSFPEPLKNYGFGLHASWEVDVWKKLRNAKESAVMNFLATIEGKNFLVTNLIAEIASNYFHLVALDRQLDILKKNIGIQENVLEIVKQEKKAARLTELALKRFEAQVFKTKSLLYDIKQEITVTENKVNFLVGRYPQPIPRTQKDFVSLFPVQLKSGIPTQLLENRADIRQAELAIRGAELDVEVARARFYPRLSISGDLGFQAYNTQKLVNAPESVIYALGANIVGPFINRMDITANYLNMDAKQTQAVKEYEKTLLNAYMEVSNQLASIKNLESSYGLRSKQVVALEESVKISNTLFLSARADYMEVLLTQREALESRFELIETRLKQLHAAIDAYRALGGGWRKVSDPKKP